MNRAIIYLVFIIYFSFLSSSQDMKQSTSIWADAKNPFNQYFVKYAWGWTFSAVCLLMVLSNYISCGQWVSLRTVQSGCRLAVGTAVWYVFAVLLFNAVEEATGVCEVSEFVTKKSCYKAGYFWRGFDTSGHCFLLSWNNLFMVEEFQSLSNLNLGEEIKDGNKTAQTEVTNSGEEEKKKAEENKDDLKSYLVPYLEYMTCFLAFLMMLGEVMMLCTSLYFHTFPEKILGIFFGLSSWYVIYNKVYMCLFNGTWHPGHVLEKDN